MEPKTKKYRTKRRIAPCVSNPSPWSGFRSFLGPEPQRIELAGDLTAVVGPNASGKTALLQCFAKIFGVTRAQRTLDRSDFHQPNDVAPDDRTTRELFIDVVLALPELKKGSATAETVAPTFRHQQIEGPQKNSHVPHPPRRAVAGRRYSRGRSQPRSCPGWSHLKENVEPDDKHAVSAADRGLIHFYYTPASRDAAAQIRATTGALVPLASLRPSSGRRQRGRPSMKLLKNCRTRSAVRDAIYRN